MILSTILYLSFGFTFALPTPSDLPTENPPLVFTRSPDIFGTRLIWNIIGSCLCTIFACTWIAVHPNIPGPEDSRWAVLRMRLRIMVYILIAPEMIIAWATKQHIAARKLAKQYQGRGWTMAHGFFISMGGFTLHDAQGTALRILEPKELHKLSKAGKIAWPAITEEEIQDRSKGDCLTKAIVLIQTTWFVVQCIVRCAYGLAVTELEVATLAFAAVTGVTYYLWWHKPLDVRCSVPVYLLQDSNRAQVDSPLPINAEIQIQPQPLDVVPIPKLNPQEPNFTATTNSNFTRMKQFVSFIQRQCQTHGTFLGLIYVLLDPFITLFTDLWLASSCDTLHDSSPLRMPTFYAPGVPNHSPFFVAIGVAVTFGSLHCLAWSFQFPSLQERLAWRISAAFVSGLPVVIGAITFKLYVPPVTDQPSKLGSALAFLLAPVSLASVVIYIFARIFLLVLPCIALRALPPSAFKEIQWTSLLPHMG